MNPRISTFPLQLGAAMATVAILSVAAVAQPTASSRASADGWSEQDQASDSLYRAAREVLNRGDYKRAAELFRQVSRRAPRERVAADALYWEAYALYRAGGSSELSTALASLERLERDFPRAATTTDAGSLRMRICGALAQRGDAACAAQVASAAAAQGAASASSASSRPGRAEASASASSQGAQQACPRDEDEEERIAALNALLQIDSDRALPVLERVLARRDRCSAPLRRKAVFLVSQKHDARAADILMRAIREDPDPEVREQAVFWLGQTRDSRAVEMLQELLQKETNSEVLEKAVFALSQHRSARAAATLRDLAIREGASLKVREQAIFWLGQSRDAENGALLRSLYGRVAEEELKEKIIFSLSQNRDAENGKFLLDVALNDREPIEMRKKALFWAGQRRATTTADLASHYNRMSDREMKEQIIFVLSQRRDPEAVEQLMTIARSEKDRELRKKAIFWLSQSRDPRVAKFLEEIIG